MRTQINNYEIRYESYDSFDILQIANLDKNSYLVAQINNYGLMEHTRLNKCYFELNQENAMEHYEGYSYEGSEDLSEEELEKAEQEYLDYYLQEFHTHIECIDDKFKDDSYENENIKNLLKIVDGIGLEGKYKILLENNDTGIQSDYLYCNALKQGKELIKAIPKDLIIQIFLENLLRYDRYKIITKALQKEYRWIHNKSLALKTLEKLLSNDRFFNRFINNNYKQLLSLRYFGGNAFGSEFYYENLQSTYKIVL